MRVGARVSAGVRVRVRAAEGDEGRGDVVVRVEVRAELYEEELRGGEDEEKEEQREHAYPD